MSKITKNTNTNNGDKNTNTNTGDDDDKNMTDFENMEDVNKDEEVKKLWDDIKDIMTSNPKIVYYGIPTATALYISYPTLCLIFAWLPWIFSIYELYKLLPTNSVTNVIFLLKQLLFILRKL
jgi:hypothetical protein